MTKIDCESCPHWQVGYSGTRAIEYLDAPPDPSCQADEGVECPEDGAEE